MSARTLKPEAGRTYRTHAGRVIRIIGTRGFLVDYTPVAPTPHAGTKLSTDFVSLSSALAEDVTP